MPSTKQVTNTYTGKDLYIILCELLKLSIWSPEVKSIWYHLNNTEKRIELRQQSCAGHSAENNIEHKLFLSSNCNIIIMFIPSTQVT